MNRFRARRSRSGMILVIAMWVVLALSGMMLVFTRAMRVELAAASNQLAAAQAEWTARGALAYAVSLVEATSGTDRSWEDAECEAVALGDGYFWFLRPDPEDGGFWDFGLTDESAKLNLNEANEDMLLMLPGMTADIATAIVDWRNPEELGLPGGAKSEHYLLLSPPYQCKSGPFETIEELLLVRGVSMELLYGSALPANGETDRGIHDLLTVYSNEQGLAASGDEPVNVNARDSGRLAALLAETVAADRLGVIVAQARRNLPFYNLLDFFYRTGLTREEFAGAVERLTVGRRARRTGLINIGVAPPEVILCLPGLDTFDVEMIVSRRETSDADLSNIAWVVDVLPENKALEAGNWITARSFQFTADILAASADGRAFRRFRAVIDARSSPPRVIAWHELTGLGWPLAPEILAVLRKGEPPPLADVRTR